jgi:hypothetical protein
MTRYARFYGSHAQYQWSSSNRGSSLRARAQTPGLSTLQPRLRLDAYPVSGIRTVLELIDLFNSPVWLFNLDCPTLTIANYCEENWL